MPLHLLLAMIGGAIGSALRFLASKAGLALLGPNYPYGTMFVNLTGGLAMGLLVGVLTRHPGPSNEAWRVLLGVGVLGGYTTFSSFSLETVNMLGRGAVGPALGYVLISAIGAITAVFIGVRLVRLLPA